MAKRKSPSTEQRPQHPVWHGCYDGNWKDLESAESMAHPAKMARLLTERIFQYLFERGYLASGDTVVDPFFGVGSTAVVGASLGVFVCGVELEPRFVDFFRGWRCPGNYWPDRMGHVCSECGRDKKKGRRTETHYCPGNFDLHRKAWEQFGDPLPVVVRGDSRKLCELLRPVLRERAQAVLGSPPFFDQRAVAGRGEQPELRSNRLGYGPGITNEYGVSEGQLSGLPPGDVSAVVSSPPYIDSVNASGHGIDWTKAGESTGNRKRGEGTRCEETLRHQLAYGVQVGQMGAMPEGDVSAIVSSPPYANRVVDERQRQIHTEGVPTGRNEGDGQTYGNSEGNLAAMPEGEVAAILGSPPYTGEVHLTENRRFMSHRDVNSPLANESRHDQYGGSEGSLGSMDTGNLADAVLSSPPYAESCVNDNQRTLARDGLQQGHNEGDGATYGGTAGNIGNLPSSEVHAIVSSPPYGVDSLGHPRGQARDEAEDARQLDRVGVSNRRMGYGSTPGQLDDLQKGDVQAIVTSPPYCDQATNGARENRAANLEKAGIDPN